MQLAATQRPHPPPVPPRPSQQVVREALKRSPRPPCPTRQAPPPPNTKPWRQEQCQEGSQPPVPCRTVVYESSTRDAAEAAGEGKPSGEKLQQRSSERNDQHSAGSHQRENRLLRTGDHDREEDREKASGSPSIKEKREEAAGTATTTTTNTSKTSATTEHANACIGKPEAPHQSFDKTGPNRKAEALSPPPKGRGIYENLQSSQTRGDLLEDEPEECSRRNEIKSDVERDCNQPGDRADDKDEIERANQATRDESTSTGKSQPRSKPRVPSTSPPRSFEEGRSIEIKKNPENHGGEEEATLFSPPLHVNTLKKEARLKERPVPLQRSIVPKDAEAPGDNTNRRSSIISVSSDDCATVVVIDESAVILEGEDNDNIHRQDWLEAGVHYSSTQITLVGDDAETDNERVVNGFDHSDEKKMLDLDYISIQERIAMSSLQGLPPLPRSLSGFNLSNAGAEPPAPPARSSSKNTAKTQSGKISAQASSSRSSPPARQLTTLDTQLAILRREMFGLRQLDLSLLSQLWSLNESIQEFRQLLQEQEDRAPSPSPSSEEGDDTSYGMNPPPPPRRPAPVHHHRPPPPPRPPRPPPSDESPSSEEYGAV
ncbi:uncharacterized protein [Prorops nasuta]|uniref:uncharacterized protein n=1 Tax=Prorops nasuta TaxID=863751 RepID=UPI0034CF6D5C